MALYSNYALDAGDEVTICYEPDADYIDLFERYGFFDGTSVVHTAEVIVPPGALGAIRAPKTGGPQAQAMSDLIIDRVNANFGYRAISRVSFVQTLSTPVQPASQKPYPELNQNRHNIWEIDDKIKDVKSPELRAALRRLGGPLNDVDDTHAPDHPGTNAQQQSD